MLHLAIKRNLYPPRCWESRKSLPSIDIFVIELLKHLIREVKYHMIKSKDTGFDDELESWFHLNEICDLGRITESQRSAVHCSVALSCLTLCDPMDCSLPGSSVHGIYQVGILEQVAISYSRKSSRPRNQTRISCVSCISRWILYHCAIIEPQVPVNSVK